MPDPLAALRAMASSPAEAVRWACVLESTAPKAGNVYPGKPFDDLTHHHFLLAADIAAEHLGDPGRPFGQRVLSSVEKTVRVTETNVNLGIVLLLCPLVVADQSRPAGVDRLTTSQWPAAIERVLDAINADDGQAVFAAIDASCAGGLGKVDQWDVHQPQPVPVDLMAAMSQSASYDRVARQYATGFVDLIEQIVPVIRESIIRRQDVLGGIAEAHVRLLAAEIDTLIARKNGGEVAERVKSKAGEVLLDDPESVTQFDAFLRSDGHRLNPGTTADLIAAAIYLMLRTPPEEQDD